MSEKKREPSCTLNHDVIRRELRDKRLSASPCPACKWVLNPAKAEDVVWMELSLEEATQIHRQRAMPDHHIFGCPMDGDIKTELCYDCLKALRDIHSGWTEEMK